MRIGLYRVVALANDSNDPNEAIKRIEFTIRAMDLLRAAQVAQEILDNASVINVSVHSIKEISTT